MRLKVSNVCQLYDKTYLVTQTVNGVTFTNNGDGSVTVNGTASNIATAEGEFLHANPGDKILMFSGYDTAALKTAFVYCSQWDENKHWIADLGYPSLLGRISTCNKNCRYIRYTYRVDRGNTATNAVIKLQIFNLTEMYGAGHEPTTVAQFRQDFPNEMYEYSPVCWKKFSRLKYVMETKNLLNITPSMCRQCTYKDGILKANVVNFYYGVLNVTDLFEIGNTYTVSWSIIHKKSLSQTASVVVHGKSKTDPDKTVFREYRSAITGSNYTFTINDEDFSSISFVELRFFRYNTITTDTESSILNIQVELGSTPTPYQPYGYLPLNRGKYIANKEPVQLLDKSKYPATITNNGVTFTNNGNGTITLNGTNTGGGRNLYTFMNVSVKARHYYYIYSGQAGTWETCMFTVDKSINADRVDGHIGFQAHSFDNCAAYLFIGAGATFNNYVVKPQFFDLTEMYGAGNEPTTVAQFKADFPNELYDYNPYNAITFR